MDNVLRCYSDDIQGVLDRLPKDLDETYERTLRDIDDQKRKYAQRLFQCLLVSMRPLRVEELAAILSVQFDTTALTSSKKRSRSLDAKGLVLSTCSSMIAITNQGGNQVVQFAHFSVKEFLTLERLATAEERLSFYHILPEPAHTLVAHASLNVLLQLDDKIDRDTIGRIPLALYAARHWVDHAQYGNVSSHVQELMERLFDPTKSHFPAWVWLYDLDRHWIEPMSTIHPTRPEAGPLYYASLCGFGALTEHLIAAHSLVLPRSTFFHHIGQFFNSFGPIWCGPWSTFFRHIRQFFNSFVPKWCRPWQLYHSPDVNSKGGSHTTALHAASVKGHLHLASLLLGNDADPDSRDDLGRVPLHRVSQGGLTAKLSLEITHLLVNSGANVNVTDDDGYAPLHAAAQFGYREIAELLLGSGASLDARSKMQETPLRVACANGKPDMVHFLINRGSDINSRDGQGSIPLHAASRCGHVDVAGLLLDCGSDVNARETQRSWTPLHQATRFGHPGHARLLLDRGADVNARTGDHLTALCIASLHGNLDLARLLIDRGADVNAQNEARWTALHLASHVGHLDIVKLLVDHDTNVDCRNCQQTTPLGLASWFGHLEVARPCLPWR
jgi:ankyrin repeat protein